MGDIHIWTDISIIQIQRNDLFQALDYNWRDHIYKQFNYKVMSRKDTIAQLDELITVELSKDLTPVNFKVLGSSNGIVMDTLFNHKTMIYINATIENARDNAKLLYDLCIVSLSPGNQDDKNFKMLMKIPLVYSGPLNILNQDIGYCIDKVKIQMQQSPKQQFLFAVKISLHYFSTEETKQTLSILILNKQQLEKQGAKNIHLLKLKCGDFNINQFSWFPLADFILVALLANQNIQIWDLSEEVLFKPSYVIKTRNFKQNYLIKKDIEFTSFAFLNTDLLIQKNESQTQAINYNKYALFLSNSIGQVISIFPFLPTQSIITKEQYDIIYDSDDQSSIQQNVLSSYLNDCQLQQAEDYYYIIKTPILQSHFHVQKWDHQVNKGSKLVGQSKLLKQVCFYDLKLFPLNSQSILTLQISNRHQDSVNSILIGLIVKPVSVTDSASNKIHQIIQIRNELSNKQKDAKLISSDSKANYFGLSKYQSIFYTQANLLYKLDLSTIFKFIKSNNLNLLTMENAFPVTLLFQLPPNETIAAIAIQQSLNCINFVRKSNKRVKFQIQILENLGSLSQIENVARISNQLLKKLNTISIAQNKNNSVAEENKKNQLALGPDKIKYYAQKGEEQLKKDYQKYCESLKNNIDQGMMKLKSSYQSLKKKLKNFSDFKAKRTKITSLLSQIQQNNTKINNLLFWQGQKSSQQGSSELSQMQQNINSLKVLLQSSRNKQLILTPELEDQMNEEIGYLFQKLKAIRVKVEESKKIKKDLSYYERD